MAFTVFQRVAAPVTPILNVALHRLALFTARARFHYHHSALIARAGMTAPLTAMLATSQHFAARVGAGWHRLITGQVML